jgi:hypothetical protein
MKRKSPTPVQPVIHVPVRIEWTEERLQALSQDQLLSLLENLDRQRSIGRVPQDAATALERLITARLTRRNGAKRRQQVAEAASAAVNGPTSPSASPPG